MWGGVGGGRGCVRPVCVRESDYAQLKRFMLNAVDSFLTRRLSPPLAGHQRAHAVRRFAREAASWTESVTCGSSTRPNTATAAVAARHAVCELPGRARLGNSHRCTCVLSTPGTAGRQLGVAGR